MVRSGLGAAWTAQAAVLAVTETLGDAIAAAQAGAEMIELSWVVGPAAERDAIEWLRARWPEVLVCGTGRMADLVRDPAVALATGAVAICADRGSAAAGGLPARQVLVEVTAVAAVRPAVQAGWAVLLDADRAAAGHSDGQGNADGQGRDGQAKAGGQGNADGQGRDGEAGLAAVVAAAALGCWLGASVIRTRHPAQAGRAARMAACIRGTRPPERTVRGLA